MDLATLFQTIRDMISKARAGDWLGALLLLLEILNGIAGDIVLPQPVVMGAALPRSTAAHDSKSVDDLLDELDAIVANPPVAGAVKGPLIDMLLPLLLALLKKWLGF